MYFHNRQFVISWIWILTASRQVLTSDQTPIRLPDRLVEAGKDFNRTCTVALGQKVNFTYPFDASGYIRKLSHFNERKNEFYEVDREAKLATATMIVRNASVLDTGSYGCVLIEKNSAKTGNRFNMEYIFVHPPLRHHVSDVFSIDDEVITEDLLLPALDVYVWEEGQDQEQVIPLKPTHPEVTFRCSRKRNDHLIEVFSTEYPALERNIWSWDKYRGLVVSPDHINRTKGVYWCDAILGGWKTSRYFRIFVIPPDNFTANSNRGGREFIADSTVSEVNDVPRIMKAVEYLIYPSGSAFQLTCLIDIRWNLTWNVPALLEGIRYKVTTVDDNERRLKMSTLRVPDTRFTDTGNYTCHRSDAYRLFANQYVFVSDGEKLLLPTESSYVFNDSQKVLLPCRPTHPDVFVSLQKPALTGRGMENITLHPTKDGGDWSFSQFKGFRSRANANRAMAGQNYLCHAERNHVEEVRSFNVLVAELKLSTIHDGGSVVVEGDDITIKCETYLMPANMTWIPASDKTNQAVEITFRNLPGGKIHKTQGSKLYTMELIWQSVNKSAAGVYECRYGDPLLNNITFAQYIMVVHDALAPRITKTEDEPTHVQTREGKTVELVCHLKVVGSPPPTVNWTWIQNGVSRDIPTKEMNEAILVNGSQSVLKFRAESYSQGEYTCLFENRIGMDQRKFQLTVDFSEDGLVAVIVVLIVIAALLIVVARIFYVRFSRTRIAPNIAKVLEPLLAGNPERINRYLPLDGQSELLPYDKRWEFPRDRLKLGKQLGAGCFGRVLKAEADGIVEESLTQTVAVKMIRSYADLSALASLVSELKILIHLGSHVNIVNLLGACTDIAKGDFLVIVEYCRFGNLHSTLLANRHTYVDQVDEYSHLLAHSANQNNGGYMNMAPPTKSHEQLCQEANPDYLVMLSAGEADSAAYQPFNSSDDHVVESTLESFSTRDLICWSFQITRGMDYLSGRKVIHGDLAARNILLADNGVAKIADFGLSRKVYEDSNYKKKGTAMLPVKWMAIESLTDRIFSTQSDVWAFGVTVWELFSLGKAPYPEMEDIGTLIHQLEGGVRMEMPRSAPSQVVQAVKICWETNPNDRPTFAQLEHILGELMEESARNYYIEMNEPYRRRNVERFGSFNDLLDEEETDPGLISGNQSTTHSGYINVDGLPSERD